jgi:DNA uptake protein ComE-like DNA-binding protein
MIFGMRLGAIRRAARIAILLWSLAIAVVAVPGRDADTPPRAGGLVDINRASAAELKALPGIQDAYAVAIVKNRPYKNKKQLLSKQVIPEVAYGKIKNRIIARQ